ncbi:MAG: dockerin type I repeat-containing protein, partial [Ruminococcus sp.]|nr:dockerin type I repeat-containing protein [Ruminococcus sp.]
DAMVTNVSDGRIKYNYSNSSGKAFKKDSSRLIKAEFTVTADEGIYEINNILHTVAGQDEKKFIFSDEAVNPIPKTESTLPDKEPYDPSISDERKYGDVDNDGRITIVDVSFIQRHLAGINTFDAVQLKYGDIDGDGNVTIVDGTYIQRWLAGILKDNPMTRFGYPRE